MKIHLLIQCCNLMDFRDGKEVKAWGTHTNHPLGLNATQITFHDEEVNINRDEGTDVFSIQWKAKKGLAKKGLKGDPGTSVKAAIKDGPPGIMPRERRNDRPNP